MWLASPSKGLPLTDIAVLYNSDHSPMLFHPHFWTLALACEAKHEEQCQQCIVKKTMNLDSF